MERTQTNFACSRTLEEVLKELNRCEATCSKLTAASRKDFEHFRRKMDRFTLRCDQSLPLRP